MEVASGNVRRPNVPILEARMWALIFRRLRLIVVVTILLPVIGAVSRRLADRTERRHSGPTTASRGLRLVESSARRARSFVR